MSATKTCSESLLAADPQPANEPSSADWATRLIEAYLAAPVQWPSVVDRYPELERDPAAGLLDLIQPVLAAAQTRLAESLAGRDDLAHCLDARQFVTAYFATLPGQLLVMLARTLVLELHVARLEQRLSGETAEQRYLSFLESLRNRQTALDLLSEYPVLAEQIQTRVDRWLSYGLQFIDHLAADWPLLRQSFPQETAGPLVRLDARGDRHRGGRSVLLVHFATGRSLVYKPKSLAVDRHFQQFITWLNQQGLEPRLRSLSVLDRGDHGWVEFVSSSGCQTEAELDRYFRRHGSLLALTYLLGGSDFHFENVVSAGEHPVLIDLEAMFHPASDVTVTTAAQVAGRLLDRSVLGTGLLPQPLWGNQSQPGIDLSGLSAAADQRMPYTVPAWEDAGTDQMRFVRKTAWFAGGRNRMTLRDRPVEAGRYVEQIDAGFERACRMFLRWRSRILAADGPLRRFAGDTVRVLLRSTRVYGQLISESFHPDLMQDAAERRQLFEHLRRICVRQPEMNSVVPSEIDDLHAGDVPLLTMYVGSCDLWTNADHYVPDFFQNDGLSCAIERLRALDERQLQRQRWLIRAALSSCTQIRTNTFTAMGSDVVATGSEQVDTSTAGASTRHARPIAGTRGSSEPSCMGGLRERLIGAANAVGDRLSELAIERRDDATWLGLAPAGARQGGVAPLGLNLYDGLPGVALFLAQWGAVGGEQRGTELAGRAVTAMRQQLQLPQCELNSPGAFAGWGGMIHCFTHLAALWQREDLLDDVRAFAARLRATIERDTMFDIVGGSAGGLVTLLNLHQRQPSDESLATALQCGERLVATHDEMPTGVGWRLPHAGNEALTGFSHGAAGISWALLRLSSVTGDDSFRRIALETLRYERAVYHADQGNWPDLRNAGAGMSPRPGERPRVDCAVAWCHGAPGIGLGRLASLPYLDDPQVRTEIDVAVHTTLANGFGHNHSLCHGDLGNIELLLAASQTLDRPDLQDCLVRQASGILRSIDERGWVCGTDSRLETPGLMTGLAGIGYGLLRLADPERVPSVLTLEPPRNSF